MDKELENLSLRWKYLSKRKQVQGQTTSNKAPLRALSFIDLHKSLSYPCSMQCELMTIVETPNFLKNVKGEMDDATRSDLVDYLANNPTAGDVIPGTCGVRKLRWAKENAGKRGSFRVVYYFYNKTIPLFLLAAYAKNVRVDISQAQKNKMCDLVRLLCAYGSKS